MKRASGYGSVAATETSKKGAAEAATEAGVASFETATGAVTVVAPEVEVVKLTAE